MPIPTEARRRLAAFMEERRTELRMRWQDVAAAGRISLKALHAARTGTSGIRPLTQRGIEDGLRWAPGSVQAILSGGEPRELGSPHHGDALIGRRTSLNPRWRSRAEFAAAAGVSEDLIRRAELGEITTLADRELHALADAYQVTAGSLAAFLAGEGDLQPAHGSTPPPDGHPHAAATRAVWQHVEGIADTAMRALEEQVRAEIRAFPPGTPPHAIFPSSAEAHLWALGALTEDERVSLIARARAEHAAREAARRRIS